MRVLVVHPWIRVGGAETLILQMAQQLNARGHEVDVATCYAEIGLLDGAYDGVRFLTPPRWVSRLCVRSLGLTMLFGGPALLWLVLRHARAYDVLNPHNFPGLWIAWCASVLWGRPLVWHFNEPAPPPLPAWVRTVDKVLARRARVITALDAGAAAKARDQLGREAEVIWAGVDSSFWGARAGRSTVAPAEGRILLTLGKIDRQKNQLMLVEVLHRLRDRLPDLQLVLVGRGPEQERVLARARQLALGERVRCTGLLPAAEVRALYARAFLVCFPALDQTWGLTPFEALAQGTVSLVSSQAGASEVLEREKIGLVARPEPDAFAEKVLQAAEHPRELKAMATRGRAYVNRALTWESFADGMLRSFAGAAPVEALA